MDGKPPTTEEPEAPEGSPAVSISAPAPAKPATAKRRPKRPPRRPPGSATPRPEAAAAPPPEEGWALVRAVPWALFVLALAAAIVFATLWQKAGSADRNRADVASTATQFLRALTNFNGATITTDVTRIRSFAVGDFATQIGTFFGPQQIDALRRAQAHSTGQVQSLFVESISGGTASVFGVVNETVTNASSSAPRTETVRFDIQMIDTRSGWKVNQVNILQSPGSSPLGSSP